MKTLFVLSVTNVIKLSDFAMFGKFTFLIALLNIVIPYFVGTSSVSCLYGPPSAQMNVPIAKSKNGANRSGESTFNKVTHVQRSKHCLFSQVCWHRHGLLFKLKSSGIEKKKANRSWTHGEWPITDLSASTVEHNGLPIDIVPLDEVTFDHVIDSSRQVRQLERAILLHRFLPSNLMHVLHDDVLPAFALWEQLNDTSASYPKIKKNENTNVNLLLVDHVRHLFDELYNLVGVPVVYSELGQITCVDKLYIGMPRITLWYQYGFKTPQGPLDGTDISMLNKFRRRAGVPDIHSKSKVNLMMSSPRNLNMTKLLFRLQNTSICTLVVRDTNRKILNIDKVKDMLQSEKNCSVHVVSLGQCSLIELRRLIGATDLLVAMHGAELALTIFLPQTSAVLEMFPYAVPSRNYTPYRTLCRLLNIAYAAWENTISANTIANLKHGINMLPEEEKARIINQTQVQPHLCCEDPAWLFRVYQDTWVDLHSFRKTLKILESLKWKMLKCHNGVTFNSLFFSVQNRVAWNENWSAFWQYLETINDGQDSTFYLSRVRNPSCVRIEDRINIFWMIPFNLVDNSKTDYKLRDLRDKNPSPGKVFTESESSFGKKNGDLFEITQRLQKQMKSTDVWYEVVTQCLSETDRAEAVLTRTKNTSVEIYCSEKLLVWIKPEEGTELPSPLTC
ncbi:putative glycosyltransferase AGO61-like [Tropilaelaps mercedesae]|uniref:Putative glycosyltransferase AGO61-like n=1 Tax=Tropilaelaps mercedesae TaxID=418985 RepID=A0A1V9XW70_9ACAR|nr:putative glycosyltransferase AGO61-like [Tropilaelaps mercedesae]